jgi:hypothetical protein
VLGEMFRGSSRVKKNFAATDPVRRAREASGLCAALSLFSTSVPFKTLGICYDAMVVFPI